MTLFVIKESFKLISRAKFSFILSLISITLSVLLIVASLLLIFISDRFQSDLKKSINITIFLDETIKHPRINQIEKELNDKVYVNSVVYIDKEQAAEDFINETGEDFRKILDYNPLPASFRITLFETYAQQDSINFIVSELSGISGVDEVVYQQEFINKMLGQIEKFKKYIFIITAALLLISVYIVYSTLQLIIKSKYEELDTMKLVGAKIYTIKAPIILNGIYIGLFAGLCALGIFMVVSHYLEIFAGDTGLFSFKKPIYISLIIGIGPVLASIISIFSLRRLNLKI
jgi:cell division transport system permease protein